MQGIYSTDEAPISSLRDGLQWIATSTILLRIAHETPLKSRHRFAFMAFYCRISQTKDKCKSQDVKVEHVDAAKRGELRQGDTNVDQEQVHVVMVVRSE